MGAAQQERRIGILTVVVVLLVVAAFWMLYTPKMPFASYVREAKFKRELANIRPPASDEPGNIQAFTFRETNLTTVVGSYSTKSDCSAIEAHYKEEFPRHGFIYLGTKEASKTQARSLSFSSQDSEASMSCTETVAGSSRSYLIIMQTKMFRD
jgi:hypothetical protein